jgi:hypothetical protein
LNYISPTKRMTIKTGKTGFNGKADMREMHNTLRNRKPQNEDAVRFGNLYAILHHNNINIIYPIPTTYQLCNNQLERVLWDVRIQIQLTRRNANPPEVNRGFIGLRSNFHSNMTSLLGGNFWLNVKNVAIIRVNWFIR